MPAHLLLKNIDDYEEQKTYYHCDHGRGPIAHTTLKIWENE